MLATLAALLLSPITNTDMQEMTLPGEKRSYRIPESLSNAQRMVEQTRAEYFECIKDEAAKWADTPSDPAVIADAVPARCLGEEERVQEAMIHLFWNTGAPTIEATQMWVIHERAKLYALAHPIAVASVTAARKDHSE